MQKNASGMVSGRLNFVNTVKPRMQKTYVEQ